MWTRKNKQDLSERKWKRYKSRRHRAKFEQSRKINLSPRRHQKTFLQHKAGKERKKKCCFYKAFVFSTLHMIARHKKFQKSWRIFIWHRKSKEFVLAPKVFKRNVQDRCDGCQNIRRGDISQRYGNLPNPHHRHFLSRKVGISVIVFQFVISSHSKRRCFQCIYCIAWRQIVLASNSSQGGSGLDIVQR